MQIDFHHTVTWVLARLSGFSDKEAAIIAYSSQYVDDACNCGVIRFHGDIRYSRTSSSHHTFDQRNFRCLSNLQVWIPFHFLPGNGGCRAGENPDGTFIEKLRCTPDSYVAKDMVDSCIEDRNRPYELHRLGITLHVYADTFAHQGFSGVAHESNGVMDFSGKIIPEPLWACLFEKLKSSLIGRVLPLGHGAVLYYPDFPFAHWQYKNQWLIRNKKTEQGNRNNPELFMKAVDALYGVLCSFRRERGAADVPGKIPDADQEQIKKNFLAFTDYDAKVRHRQWRESIQKGEFSFGGKGTECPQYIPKGVGSWKHLALGTEKEIDDKNDIFEFNESFLYCNWKLFHDALQKHRFVILRDILPRYGICGA